MRSFVWYAAILFSMSTTALADDANSSNANDASYYCVVEASGGLTWSPDAKRWIGTSFRPDHKFIFKLRFLKARNVEMFGNVEQYKDYRASLTEAGTSDARSCIAEGGSEQEVSADTYGWLSCTTGLVEYRLNLVKLRFLEVYKIGYADGRDSKGDTPYVGGGTCTKIN
jgi:hypothetical protein